MEFAIINASEVPRTSVPVKVTTRIPKDPVAAVKIADSLEAYLSTLIGARKSGMAVMPPEDGGAGRWYYFMGSDYCTLVSVFKHCFWDCAHEVVGDELDEDQD
jgi:hypothetical protein